MITAGIDCGAKNTRTVIIRDNKIVGRGETLTGFDQSEAVMKSLGAALNKADLDESELWRIGATGSGFKAIPQTVVQINEARSMAASSCYFFPSGRVAVDVGAEESRVVRFDAGGLVRDFALNEKCAAGAGSFIEAMARALETSVHEMGELALMSENPIPMNAQCTIFAESEIIGLIHARTPKMDISRAILDAVASRIASMIRRVGLQPDVVLLGGMACNTGFVSSLKRELGIENILIPDYPEYGAATGAALIAAGEGTDGNP